jgi:hypothetical protein
MAENGKEERADARLLTALAAGATVRDAARRAGVSERTAHRRLADPAFRQRVTEARAEMVERALGQLADGASEAVGTLRKLLKAKADPVKLSAARTILEVGNKLRESVELQQRIAALEQRLKGKESA